MAYINVGADYNGRPIATKTALKSLLKSDPLNVRFYGTSDFTPFGGDVTAIGSNTLTVVGPDPYRKRTWYASVKMTSKGVTVS